MKHYLAHGPGGWLIRKGEMPQKSRKGWTYIGPFRRQLAYGRLVAETLRDWLTMPSEESRKMLNRAWGLWHDRYKGRPAWSVWQSGGGWVVQEGKHRPPQS